MIYGFGGCTEVPFNDRAVNRHVTQHESGLSDEEIMRIRAIGDPLEKTSVKLFGRTNPSRVKAVGTRLRISDETRWIYERMEAVVHAANALYYRYDLSCFGEHFYYLQYRDGEHFDWHLDIGPGTPAPRKLSLVLQLSDPSEYDGGDFDVLAAIDHERSEKAKGLILAFPSYKIHRVTPVTRGIRRTLVMFACGPNFR